jgi:hypothetical protein
MSLSDKSKCRCGHGPDRHSMGGKGYCYDCIGRCDRFSPDPRGVFLNLLSFVVVLLFVVFLLGTSHEVATCEICHKCKICKNLPILDRIHRPCGCRR